MLLLLDDNTIAAHHSKGDKRNMASQTTILKSEWVRSRAVARAMAKDLNGRPNVLRAAVSKKRDYETDTPRTRYFWLYRVEYALILKSDEKAEE